MATTEYGDISQRTAAWAAQEMLAHAESVQVLTKFGQTKPVPKNKADTVKFRRPVPFGAATTPLTEGVTPTAQQMSYEDVSVTLAQYGAVVDITDKIEDLAEDPVLSDASMLCGEQAAETAEMVTYGVVKAGTNVGYANGTARTDVNTAVSVNALRLATRTLRAQRAKPMTRILNPSPNYGTSAIEAAFVAFCHSDCDADIRGLTGFVPVAEYGSRQPLCPEELGSVENVRFITSPLLESWADGGGAKGTMKSTGGTLADVYPILIVGQDAYGHVPLKGKEAIKPSVLRPNVPRGGDPLGQKGSVGWKAWLAPVILNQLWMYRLEVAVTAL